MRHGEGRDDAYWMEYKKKARNFQAPWRRKKGFLVDGLVKGTPPIPNIILALLKITWRRKR